MPNKQQLPYALYRAEQVRAFDRLAITQFGLSGDTLMERAGQSAYDLLRRSWPAATDITVVAGTGNNAGDGYVLARLALAEGLRVHVLQLGDAQTLTGDANKNLLRFVDVSGALISYAGLPKHTDVIVDAILGTGLTRLVTGQWADAIAEINQHSAPVLALDIASGLDSDTGAIKGIAVLADHSMSFIGLKQGMFTGEGPACSGVVHFDTLAIPARIYASSLLAAKRIEWQKLQRQWPARNKTTHKGQLGHVLVVGGSPGFGGAPRLAATAAARTGAGLVTLATAPEHVVDVLQVRPEIMVHGIKHVDELMPLLTAASVVAVGPGLGKDAWGRALWQRVQASGLPMVVDADALNQLAEKPQQSDNWVLTPHPGEAARLLQTSTKLVQEDRFKTVDALAAKYSGVVVLKGAGTLIADRSSAPPGICSDGNPGMASGGMGDVLTGIIAGLLAQGFDLREAAEMGVCIHARAADLAAEDSGERGLLAADLFPYIQRLVN